MDKLFWVMLAVCLVSAQAFVKRDAPTDTNNAASLAKHVQKEIEQFTQNFSEKFKDVLNPDFLKENFNKFVDNAKAMADSLQNKDKKTE